MNDAMIDAIFEHAKLMADAEKKIREDKKVKK